MKKNIELSNLINQLKNIFVYDNGRLLYDEKKQFKANVLLQKILLLTGTFDSNIKNERENIRNELTLVDTSTGEETMLVDIDSIDERVKSVLSDNNLFSCLKSLALCNKCAHSFDGEINKIRGIFEKYYSLLYPDSAGMAVSFYRPLEDVFPEIKNSKLYDLGNITNYDFEKLCNVILSDNKKVNKGIKISVLRMLNVSFEIKSDEDINRKFDIIVKHIEIIINSFLVKKYAEGMELLQLQNRMFSIKDDYISMVGQLLKNGSLKKIEYELVRTEDAQPGFEYMLIIDDVELSYYIEVHMPNFIAEALIKQYGLVESRTRTTQKLGASAVYKRDSDEVTKIRDALTANMISDGLVRAKIISRGDIAGGLALAESTLQDYTFITSEISHEKMEIEEYLELKKMHQDDVEENRLIVLNENYSEEVTREIVSYNYLKIYQSFTDKQKYEFVLFSLNKLKEKDAFDKHLANFLISNYSNYDINFIAKIIIYKDKYKRKFIDKNKENIDEIKINDKVYIDNLLNNYIENLIVNAYSEESNNNGQKHKR